MDVIRRNKLSTVIVVMVVGYVLLGMGVRFVRAYRYQGEWARFDSQNFYRTATFPDGFRLDYPKSWEVSVLEKGGTKNLGELRVRFIRPNYLIIANTYLYVWWRRVDEGWSLEEARRWYVEELAFGIREAELAKRGNAFEKTTVGIGNYPALSQSFELLGRGHPRKQVVLVVVGDEAFAFSFQFKGDDEAAQKIFSRMLDSLEIYQ